MAGSSLECGEDCETGINFRTGVVALLVDGRLRGHDVEWVALARISSWPRMITDEIAKIVGPEAVNVGLSIRARRNPLTRMALNRLASCRG